MELNPFKISRNAAWYTLHKTGLSGVARAAIHSFIPSRQVQDLLQSQAVRQRHRESIILHGAGELELQVQKGLVEMDDSARQQLWMAVKSGKSGVEFGDVFDPHVANILETTTPGCTEEKKDSRLDEFWL